MTNTIEQSVDVDVAIAAVYAQWTQFETFPSFMNGIEEVRQVDETHLHFKAKIAGVEREWDAEVTEQHPEERVAWRSTSGQQNAGVVTFHKLSDTQTRVMLQQDIEPEGIVEKAGSALGIVEHTAKNDLERFKTFIEGQGAPTGEWSGEVPREG